MTNLVYDTARAVADVMCGIVEVRVGTGYPMVEGEGVSFVAVTFLDEEGKTLTIALTDEQAGKLLQDLANAAKARL